MEENKNKKFRVSYTLYDRTYREEPENYSVITSDPWGYIERVKADLLMAAPHLVLGTYTINPLNHLKRIK
jgi:hypothetical protein